MALIAASLSAEVILVVVVVVMMMMMMMMTWSLMSSDVGVDILGTECDQCVCMVQCCFTSTETVRLIRTGKPRTATSTFTQLLNSVILVVIV